MPRKISTVRAISQIPTSKPCVSSPSQPGKTRQVEPAEQRVGDDLEEGVEDDEHGGAFPVALGDVVPDQHHRDAAREADDDHAGAVGGLVGKQQPGEREHEQRPDDPGEEERDAEEPAIADAVVAHAAELLVADLRQHRVHHQQQPERDRQRDRADLQLVEPVVQRRDQRAEPEPADHREPDPERQEPVERREPSDHVFLSRHWLFDRHGSARGLRSSHQATPARLGAALSASSPTSAPSCRSRSRLAQ